MSIHLHRSVDHPLRDGLSWTELWEGPDKGLIWCWERGRQKRSEDPDLAARADKGELVTLPWKGGTKEGSGTPEERGTQTKYGTLKYLAMWQGLRHEALDLALEGERVIVCSRTKRSVVFRATPPLSEE
jgi:hypothetical protein